MLSSSEGCVYIKMWQAIFCPWRGIVIFSQHLSIETDPSMFRAGIYSPLSVFTAGTPTMHIPSPLECAS